MLETAENIENSFNAQSEETAREELRYGLADEQIKEIVEAARNQDSDTVFSALLELRDADTAELLSKVNAEDRKELLSMYSESFDPEVFTELDQELRRAALSEMPAESVAYLIAELESDDALLLIESLDPDFQQEVIKYLSTKSRLALEEGLNFPEDSAGRLMRRELVAVPEFWTVGKTLDYLHTAASTLPEEFFSVLTIDPSHHLTGNIPLDRLVRTKRSDHLKDLIIEEENHPVLAEMDQEDVAHMFRREDIVLAPVVNDENRLIGVITIDDVVDVIDQETQEDIMRMAGVEEGDLYRAVISTTGTRFRWLFVNLLTAILASIVISWFDATIEQVIALAVLMPIVASMGGNAGTQALTVAVRAIATHKISRTNTWQVIWKETLVGAINGILFACITGLIAALWFHNPVLGFVIAMAMVINLIAAGLFGAGIPLMLERMGSDPAISSTVLLTTVTDVIGFLSFLGLAAIFMI
ncbi:MAG: magnesium transporter [Alphaproteobacteria bacterium]|nr:magnesium transporter [Alphaproteobacteria bacterium]